MKRRLPVAIVITAAIVVGVSAAAANGLAGRGLTANARTAQQAAPAYQPPTENLFVPITPCRIVDTRAGTGTGGSPFAPLQTRTYYVSGTFGFGPQGGHTDGCGIPNGSVAVAATFLVVAPTSSGRIQAWPNGQSEPTATTFFYGHQTSSSGNTVTLNPSTAYSLKIRNYTATTDLVIDVTGYYVKPLAAMISPSGGLYAGSSRAVASTQAGTGEYRITFDRDVHNCTIVATVYLSSYYASVDGYSQAATNEVVVNVFTADGVHANQYVYVHAIC